jgi:uncharacterized protein (DUF608 family)
MKNKLDLIKYTFDAKAGNRIWHQELTVRAHVAWNYEIIELDIQTYGLRDCNTEWTRLASDDFLFKYLKDTLTRDDDFITACYDHDNPQESWAERVSREHWEDVAAGIA